MAGRSTKITVSRVKRVAFQRVSLLCLGLLSACAYVADGYLVSGNRVTYTSQGNCGSCRGGQPPVVQKVVGADPKTFRVIKPQAPVTYRTCDGGSKYAVDRSSVYVGPHRIEGADPKTFRFLDDVPFPQDDEAVFVCAERIVADNPSQRRLLFPDRDEGRHIWIMGDTIYYMGDPIFTGVDNETVRTISDSYARDKNRIYYFGQLGTYSDDVVVDACDPATFEVLNRTPDGAEIFVSFGEWARDSQCAYFGSIVITDVDLASFEAVASGHAQDATRTYRRGFGEFGSDNPDLQIFITPR